MSPRSPSANSQDSSEKRSKRLSRRVAAALKKLRRINDADEFGVFATNTIGAVKKISAKAKTESEAEFAAWLKDVNATESTMTFEDAQGAFNGYFDGEAPFKTIENREDIPDALIWQAVKRLASEHRHIHFVVGDKTLRAAADDHDGIITYAKLDEFIQTDQCQDALKEISANENRERNRARVRLRLPGIVASLTKRLQSDMITALDGKEVKDSSIPDDNNEGMVIGVGEASYVEFDFARIEYYGDDEIGIPFTASVECTVNYAVYKADYYTLDEDKMERMSIDERNRHYYDVDEEYTLAVNGVLSLTIDSGMLEDELEDGELEDVILQADTDVEVEEIEVK
ncbi:MAG TPA: PIN domain-containing protein [Bryobacteraceae bacterium]|jgi:hypothetical protein|nr:PIN domain-containing protein [Bryobacteraceae bacterium]